MSHIRYFHLGAAARLQRVKTSSPVNYQKYVPAWHFLKHFALEIITLFMTILYSKLETQTVRATDPSMHCSKVDIESEIRDVEMAQLVKCWSCKHDDLNLIPVLT